MTRFSNDCEKFDAPSDARPLSCSQDQQRRGRPSRQSINAALRRHCSQKGTGRPHLVALDVVQLAYVLVCDGSYLPDAEPRLQVHVIVYRRMSTKGGIP